MNSKCIITSKNIKIVNKNMAKKTEIPKDENSDSSSPKISSVIISIMIRALILFLPIIFSIIFMFQSASDSSTMFSFALSIFSGLIVVAFEISEWVDFVHKIEKDTNDDYKDKNIFPIILVFLLLILVFFIYNGLVELKIVKIIPDYIPNLITSTILFLYFVSYFIRNILV